MITSGDLMKRTLDEIELEEIESFYMEQTRLIVKTKTEENVYQYVSELELLKRISYFFHRYEVEYNRREASTSNQKSTLEPNQQAFINDIQKRQGLMYLILMSYPLLALISPALATAVLNLLVVSSIVVAMITTKETKQIRAEVEKKQKEQKETKEQIDKGFESLKEASKSYLSRITKNGKVIERETKHYIENIEKGYQKRIGVIK